MDIKTASKPFNVLNKYEGRVVSGAFSLGHSESRIVDPAQVPQTLLDDLEIFYKRGNIDVQFDVESSKSTETLNTKNISTANHEHTVFNGLNEDSKLINVESIENTKALEVGESNADKIENAKKFLSEHWKTIEKELKRVFEIEDLKLLLSVANDLGMNGNKKYELIEERYKELNS